MKMHDRDYISSNDKPDLLSKGVPRDNKVRKCQEYGIYLWPRIRHYGMICAVWYNLSMVML